MVNRTALLFLLAAQIVDQPSAVGLKISERSSIAGLPERHTIIYVQSDRRRREYRTFTGSIDGPPLAEISRCDLNQNLYLNLEDRQYATRPIPKLTPKQELQARVAKITPPAEPPKPTILVEITTVDTGERKKIFGYDARHVITTRKQTNLNGDADGKSEEVTDGWYTDLSTTLDCEPKPTGRAVGILTSQKPGQPFPEPTVKFVGKPESGFALSTTDTHRSTNVFPDGSKHDYSSVSEMQITELYSGPLDSSLFEVPGGFTKVDEIRRNPPVSAWLRLREYWNSVKLEVSRYFH